MIEEILEISAFYPISADDTLSGAADYRRLAIRLEELSPWLADLAFDRRNIVGGRDVKSLSFPEAYAAWRVGFEKRFPHQTEGNVIAATTAPFIAQRGQRIWASLSYSWGHRGSHDSVYITIPILAAGRDEAIPLLRRIFRVLVEWRPCLLVSSLPSEFKFDGRLFEDRQTSGTGIWITQDLAGVDLSAAYQVEPLLNGTLILPVGHVFTYDDKESQERVREIDGHLAEQGLLPHVHAYPFGA